MKINKDLHLDQAWFADELLADFNIEDVWKLPIELRPHHTLNEVQEVFSNAIEKIGRTGISGKLFQLRFFLGRILKWDEQTATAHKPLDNSIRKRFAEIQKLELEDAPELRAGEFTPVYKWENESLLEIENKTVHAAIHFGKIQIKKDNCTVQMAVYVKPKGLFGKVYMLIIKPFRLLLVYPAMLRALKIQWNEHNPS